MKSFLIIWLLFSNSHASYFRRALNTIKLGAFFKGKSFSFRKMDFIDKKLILRCEESCFIQGSEEGFGSFLPFSTVIENPIEGSENPYWKVSVFRLGFNIRSKIHELPELLGLEIPFEFELEFDGKRMFLVYEFIRISPMKSANQNLGFQRPLTLSRNIKKQVLNSMREGEILLTSRYMGAVAALEGGYPFVGFSPILEVEGELALTSRTLVAKDNGYWAYWMKGKMSRLELLLKANFGYAGPIYTALSLPILSGERETEKVWERSYYFQESQRNYLENSMFLRTKNLPPMQFARKERYQNKISYSLRSGLLKLFNFKVFNSGQYTRTTDYQKDEEKYSYTMTQGRNFSRWRNGGQRDFDSSAQIGLDTNRNYFAVIRDYRTLPNTSGRRAQKEWNSIRSHFPKNAFPDIPNQFIKMLTLESNFTINEDGLTALFAKEDLEICRAYTLANNWNTGKCYRRFKDPRVSTFLRDFRQARKYFQRLEYDRRDYWGLRKKYAMKQVIDIFYRYHRRRNIHKFFGLTLASNQYSHTAKLSYNGSDYSVHEGVKMIPTALFSLFSDPIMEALSPFLFIGAEE